MLYFRNIVQCCNVKYHSQDNPSSPGEATSPGTHDDPGSRFDRTDALTSSPARNLAPFEDESDAILGNDASNDEGEEEEEGIDLMGDNLIE